MNQYDIISNGITLNTYEDLDISINKELKDILDITKRSTDWTRPISLPGTSVNNKFFKQLFDVNIESISFNPNKKIRASIMVGDNVVLSGYMQLLKIYVNNGMVEYDISIFGTLTNIVNLLGDKQLTQIDLSEYNHKRDRQTIQNSWYYTIQKNNNTIQLPGPGEGYVYPYIVYGGSTDIENNIYIYDIYPAVYTKTVIEKMFDEIGYKIKSKLFDSEYFRMKIEPFVNDKLQLSEEDYQKRVTTVGVVGEYIAAGDQLSRGSNWYSTFNIPYTRESGTVTQQGSDLIFQDLENQWNGNKYINKESGWYDLYFLGNGFMMYIEADGDDIDYVEGSGTFEFQFTLFKNGQVLDQLYTEMDPGTGDNPSPWTDVNRHINAELSADNVFLAPNDEVKIEVKYRYPGDVKWVGISDDKVTMMLLWKDFYDGKFSMFQAKPTSNNSQGNEDINLSSTLPDNYSCVDFLGDLVKEHNLIITEDSEDDKTLIIETEKEYFASKQKVLDWELEEKLDYESDYEITPMSEIDAKTYLFKYSDDDDLYNKEYKDEVKETYGTFKIDVDNDFSDKVNKTELKVAATPTASKFINGRVAPFFVTQEDENLKKKKVKPRRLFYGGLIDGKINLKDHINSTVYTESFQYPYCGMYDHPTNAKYDLGFGMTEKIYFNTNQIPNNNLYNMFYKDIIDDIINPNSRLLEGKFYLTPKDIANFDFRDVVFLLDAYWRVIEIKDYNPISNDKLTNVTLLKINNINIISTDFVEIPTSNNSCPVDLVLRKVKNRYQYVSQSGKPVSYDCCRSKGGSYVEGVCYIGELPMEDNPIGVNVTGGINVKGGIKGKVPVLIPEGPSVFNGNQSTTNSNGVKNVGQGNYIPAGVDQTVRVNGDNITVRPGVKNVLAIGDDIYVTDSNSIYIGNTVINGSGNIQTNFNLVLGGRDELRFSFPTISNINTIRCGRDSLRAPSFDFNTNLLLGGRDSL